MLKKWVLPTLLVGVLYAAASELALQLLRYAAETAVVWFASGVGLAAMLLLGTRALPGVLLGTLLCGLMAGKPVAMVLGTAALTTGQIWLSWWLLVRVAGFDPAMERVRDMMKLAVIGATVSPLLNAGRVFLEHRFGDDALTLPAHALVKAALLGEMAGILLLVPAVLAWARPRGEGLDWRQRAEATLLYGTGIAAAFGVFASMLQPMLLVASLPYAMFPVLFWAAARFGPRETATLYFLIGLVAVGGTGLGRGPFGESYIGFGGAYSNLAELYLFLLVLGGTSLIFAAGRQQLAVSQRALRDSEEKYRLLVDHQTDLVAKIGVDGRIQYVSPSHRDFYGKPEAEFVGRMLTEAVRVHDEDLCCVRDAWKEMLSPPYLTSHEHRVLTPRGWRWVAVQSRAVLGADGRPQFVVAVARDITDRRRAEEQARQHLQQLAHVSRVSSMGEMASAIAHEINQPLTAIANYASACLRLLRSGKAQAGEAMETMQRVAAEAERAGEIVRKMRGFVRGEEGQMALVEPAYLAAEVMRLAAAEARQSGVELRSDVEPGLPPVLADSIQIQQVLLNLVRNAVEAVDGGDGPRREVDLTVRRAADGGVHFTVRDTGPGLAPAALDKVFEPFYTTKPDGIGIGLPLSRSIADAHGGRVWASAEAEGAAFHLVLPTAQELEHAAA
ncbi:MAG TPA: ATP-binding protein [Burkholderiales bacterium]|nr:ATP-binding protein [Burkholderiales bacterium]